MSTGSADFIVRSLAELEAEKQSRTDISAARGIAASTHAVAEQTRGIAASTHDIAETTHGMVGGVRDVTARTHTIAGMTRWLTIAAVIVSLLLFGTAMFTLKWVREAETRVVKVIKDRPLVNPKAVVQVRQWTTGDFGSGVAECGSEERQPIDPCKCWYSQIGAERSECTSLMEIASANRDTLLVFAIGGHDRDPLSGTGKKEFGNNGNLAQLRARAVFNEFKDTLDQAREAAGDPALDAGTPTQALSIRGVWDTDVTTRSDRTVTVTLFRQGETS